MKLIEQQSQELNPHKRLALVSALQKKVEQDAARPLLDWRLDYFTVWPYVKNLVPHDNIYNFGRMADVWRGKEPAPPPGPDPEDPQPTGRGPHVSDPSRDLAPG